MYFPPWSDEAYLTMLYKSDTTFEDVVGSICQVYINDVWTAVMFSGEETGTESKDIFH